MLLSPYFKATEILNIFKHTLAPDSTQLMCIEVKYKTDLLIIREEISVVIILWKVFQYFITTILEKIFPRPIEFINLKT